MTSRARLEADFTLWIGRSCRPNSSAPASARSLNWNKELTERIVLAIRQDIRDTGGPQPSASYQQVSPAEKAHYSTYTSQRSLVVRGAPAFEGCQHICFLIRILSGIQRIRSALSGPFFQVLSSFIGLLTGTVQVSVRRLLAGVLSVLTTYRAGYYSGAKIIIAPDPEWLLCRT
jgi:hypothetical protein